MVNGVAVAEEDVVSLFVRAVGLVSIVVPEHSMSRGLGRVVAIQPFVGRIDIVVEPAAFAVFYRLVVDENELVGPLDAVRLEPPELATGGPGNALIARQPVVDIADLALQGYQVGTLIKLIDAVIGEQTDGVTEVAGVDAGRIGHEFGPRGRRTWCGQRIEPPILGVHVGGQTHLAKVR